MNDPLKLYRFYALDCQDRRVIPKSSEVFVAAYNAGFTDGQLQSAPLDAKRLLDVMGEVRQDIWTSQIFSNPQSTFDKINEALAKLDAVLGEVSDHERLETLFPNLRSGA